jgi:hypothetical protein
MRSQGWSRGSWSSGLLVLVAALGAVPLDRAHASVKQAILEVDLKNPGVSVSAISFFFYQPGRLYINLDNVYVSSPPGKADRFAGAGSVVLQASPTDYNKDTGLYGALLTPLQTFKPGQNIQFVMTVPDVNGISIMNGAIMKGDGSIVGGAPQWFDNGNPPQPINPGPKLPGFKVQTKDADYTVYNDPDDPFGIDNLQFLPNIAMAQFDSLDLDAVLDETPNSDLALSALSSFADFPNLPDPEPGNLFIAEGQLLDAAGDPIGAFAEGVQVGIPEPSTTLLFSGGLAMLAAIARNRRPRNPARRC